MKEEVFRKKSLDKITSPEQMDACLKVVNPPAWIALAAGAIFIIGLLLWGILGEVETRLTVQAISDGETVYCVLPAEHDGVEVGETVRIEEEEFLLTDIYYDSDGNIFAGLDDTLPEGVYEASIVTDTVNPIKFLIN